MVVALAIVDFVKYLKCLWILYTCKMKVEVRSMNELVVLNVVSRGFLLDLPSFRLILW